MVAAGAGERLGAGGPKALVRVDGVTLLEHAVTRVLAAPAVDLVVVVAPEREVAAVRALVSEGVLVTIGGPTRRDSVAAGLAALASASIPAGRGGRAQVDVVLVHDAARCLAPPSLVQRVVAAVRAGHPVVVPAVPVHDSVRALGPDGVSSTVVDRSALLAVQTPQGFARAVLEDAHRRQYPSDAQPGDADLGDAQPGDAGLGRAATDDASLAERLGHPVHLLDGAEEAFKVTVPLDLARVRAVLASGPA